MRTFVIVQPNSLLNSEMSLGKINKSIIEAILQFQNTIEKTMSFICPKIKMVTLLSFITYCHILEALSR